MKKNNLYIYKIYRPSMKAKIIIVLVIFFLISSYTRLFAGGWTLLQNSPTTNDLHSVFFLDDDTGWIAGDNSTIYKTTNSGVSWVQQTSPEASNFQCIIFVSAETGWACGTGGTVIKTTNGGANWFSQTFTASKFNSMDFINSNTGFIAGDFGNIYKTINEGITWTPQVSGVNQSLHQINIRGGQTVIAVGDNAIILRTTNYGVEWITQSGPGIVSQIFYTLAGFPIISIGTLTKYSADGGVSWNLSEFPTEPIYSLTEMEDNKCLGVGGNGYIVYAIFNQDSGVYFTQEPSPTTQNLYSVHYPKLSNFIWAVGAGGTILKYLSDWSKIYEGGMEWKDIDFINQNTGWAIIFENNMRYGIKKTTDGGNNWIYQIQMNYDRLASISFVDENTGFIVGDNNIIKKTTDGGLNWSDLNSNFNYDWYSVYFTDVNTGWVCGTQGKIIKTSNGGNNWDTLTTGITSDLLEIKFINANTGFAISDRNIIKTVNGGMNWSIIHGVTGNGFITFDMLDENIGWFVYDYFGDSYQIMKTTNGGVDWLDYLSTPSGFFIRSLDFLDSNIGFICGNNSNLNDGCIYKSTDGGVSWAKERIILPIKPESIEFIIQNNTAFGFCAGNNFFSTSFEYFGGEPGGNSGSYPGWVQVNSGTTTGFLTCVDYINPFVAYAVGGPNDGQVQNRHLF